MSLIVFGGSSGGRREQSQFSEENIQAMLSKTRRKQVLNDWKFINPPPDENGDYGIGVPLKSIRNAFDEAFPNIQHTTWVEGAGNSNLTYLKNITEKDLKEISDFFNNLIGSVAINDCLPISFAMNFEREEGNPDNEQTDVGALRRKAKPYGTELVQQSHYDSAKKLADMTSGFIKLVRFYNDLDSIIGMPPSNPAKVYKLTHILSKHISEKLPLEDLTHLTVKTVATRPSKELPVNEKLNEIRDSVEVSTNVEGRKILLLDDLYQSGVTMNYVAMLLLEKGAKKVYGLACEKTLRNDDNTG